MSSSKNFARPARWACSWALGFLLLSVGPAIAASAPDLDRELTPDTSLPIPPLKFDSAGQLVIEASATSSKHDFDYLIGDWKLLNRKLKSRLARSDEWMSFESAVQMHQILDGVGNIDRYTENVNGTRYEGVALRLFDTRTKLWSIYWADSNSGKLDPPVVGSFANKIGHFFARDTYKGQNISARRWSVRRPADARDRPVPRSSEHRAPRKRDR